MRISDRQEHIQRLLPNAYPLWWKLQLTSTSILDVESEERLEVRNRAYNHIHSRSPVGILGGYVGGKQSTGLILFFNFKRHSSRLWKACAWGSNFSSTDNLQQRSVEYRDARKLQCSVKSRNSPMVDNWILGIPFLNCEMITISCIQKCMIGLPIGLRVLDTMFSSVTYTYANNYCQ